MCSLHGNSYYLPDNNRLALQPSQTRPGQENALPEPGAEIGYVLMGFPRISETFITHEIYQLEQLGMKLRIFAVKLGDMDKVHDVVSHIRAPLTYLPRVSSLSGTGLFRWLAENFPLYSRQHFRLLKARPLAYLGTLASSLWMSWKYRSRFLAPPKKVFIKEFLQAGHIAMQVIDAGSVRHLHGHFCHGATTITWMASRLTGLPFSFTAHAKDIYQTDQNPGDLLHRKLSEARFATTCTGANASHLAENFPACGKVHKIYHGLDTGYFSPGNNSRSTSAIPQILAVGRFVEKKGFQYLIEACAILKNQGIPFQCKILGEQGNHHDSIVAQIARLELGQHISLHEPVTHDALLALYRESHIFALPCLIAADGDRDGIPNVLAEAMSTGLAAVTTNVSGIPELVREGIDGLIVPQKDSVALARALQRLIEDPDLRMTLGLASRERVCQVFDSSKTTIELKNLFLEILYTREHAT